jgi:NAD(P)-dependent dehydrogenase (short-subunit alcohol dehydrogenase family)
MVLLSAGMAVGVLAGAAMAASANRPPYDWAGRTVLITGGSRGLGLVLARELVARGARVAICARDRIELAHARADLGARGGDVFAVVCDVTDESAVRSMVRTVEQRLGPIGVLINNAGVISVAPAEDMTSDDYEAALRTHFWAPLYTMMAVLPGMRERGAGRIVNISSIGGKLAVPHMAPYCASKFALAGVSEALREEFFRYGVRITTVYPGLMQTGGPVNALFKGHNKAEYTWFALTSSVPGLVMSPERAARKILAAAERGSAQAILGLPAKLAANLHGHFPDLWTRIMGELNRILPGPGGTGTETHTGTESESALSTSILTRAVYRAAERNNQFGRCSVPGSSIPSADGEAGERPAPTYNPP